MKTNVHFNTMRSIIRRMRNISGKSCTETRNTHFTIRNFFPPLENRAVCEIKWKNIVESERPQKKIWRMRISRWIPKATNTHSEYVIFISFLLQQWLHECASCYVIRTLSALFQTSLCTNTYIDPATHKESNLPNYSSYVVLQSKRYMDYIPPQWTPEVRPMSIFIIITITNACS